jgi:hypothetical protein
MKAVLEFNLEEEEDRMAHFRCVKSLDMALAMWEFAESLRSIVDASEDGKWIDEEVVWKAWQYSLSKNGIFFCDLIR